MNVNRVIFAIYHPLLKYEYQIYKIPWRWKHSTYSKCQ